MAVLDFKEIPKAHKVSGLQDTFELFARDFLSFIGYKILTDPDRGADGGVEPPHSDKLLAALLIYR